MSSSDRGRIVYRRCHRDGCATVRPCAVCPAQQPTPKECRRCRVPPTLSARSTGSRADGCCIRCTPMSATPRSLSARSPTPTSRRPALAQGLRRSTIRTPGCAIARSRRRAGRTTGPARPWFENAMHTADDEPAAPRALAGLEPRIDTSDRLRAWPARSSRRPPARSGSPTAPRSCPSTQSLRALTAAGVDATTRDAAGSRPASVFAAICTTSPSTGPSRLRREGNRRRRSHMVLAGLTVIALVIGAGAVTATQR